MLKRIFIDNFKSLSNFEIRPEAINLWMGINGSGKSSVFDVLRKLQTFIGGKSRLSHCFFPHNISSWQRESRNQIFELDIEGNGGLYSYKLSINHEPENGFGPTIIYESLSFNQKALIEFKEKATMLMKQLFIKN